MKALQDGWCGRSLPGERRACRIAMVALALLALCIDSHSQVTAIPSDERLASAGTDARSEQQWLAELGPDRAAVAAHPDSAQAFLTLGKALHALGETQAASQALDQALKLESNLPEALIEKGSILADEAHWPEAADLFRRAAEVSPRSAVAHLWLGDMLLRTGNFTGAAGEFATVTKIDDRNSGAWQGVGLVRLQQGDFSGAADAFRNALAIRPGYLDADEGLAHALGAAHQWPEAAEILRKVVAAQPDSAAEAVALGTALARLGKKEEADQLFARAKEFLDRELMALRAKGENNWGVELRSEGKAADAVAAFHRALDDDPDYCEAHDNLGGVLWMQKDAAAAMPEFQAAVRCDPNLASARNNLGTALLYASHDVDGAIVQFHAAVAVRPGFALAHLNLGKALAAKQEFAGAIVEFRSALAIDPALAAAHLGLGLALAEETNTVSAEARAEMAEGLHLDPTLRAIVPQQYLTKLP